jgi:tetratricopeptide (TPR) repeat protein
MSDRIARSRVANEFRKSGELPKAMELYRELVMEDGSDPFAAAGLLHCLRKQGLFTEALQSCEKILKQHQSSDWCRNEVIWTLIQGRLEQCDESTPLVEITSVAEKILSLGPQDNISRWRIVRYVLKAAKARTKWDIILEWTNRVESDALSTVPMKDDLGRDGWSDQAVWYNLKIRSMIESGEKEQAIVFARTAIERFPRQSTFFRRLEALATLRLSRLTEAERIYRGICNTGRPEWWILHEYARLLQELGKPHEALRLMCKAAVSHKKLPLLVTLFSDIGFLCSTLHQTEHATHHFQLCRSIRQEQGWSIPHSIEMALISVDNDPNQVSPGLKESLAKCRVFWLMTLGVQDDRSVRSLKNKKIISGLQGKLQLGDPKKPFCFIFAEKGESYFCLKNDLPVEMVDGALLSFDVIPSFDKKKNKESWRAINIRFTQSNLLGSDSMPLT